MHFKSFTVALLSLIAPSLAEPKIIKDFEPITEPKGGDTIQIGSNFTIKWDYGAAYYPGHMRISLVRGDSLDELAIPIPIAESVATNEVSYKWQIGNSLGAGDNYWIMVTYLKDQDVINYSSKFSLSAESNEGNSDSSSSSSSPTSIATGPVTSTSLPSAIPISTTTQSGGGSIVAPTPFAVAVVAAIGIAAF